MVIVMVMVGIMLTMMVWDYTMVMMSHDEIVALSSWR